MVQTEARIAKGRVRRGAMSFPSRRGLVASVLGRSACLRPESFGEKREGRLGREGEMVDQMANEGG